MAKQSYLVLRENSKTEYGLRLEREVYAEPDGLLSQDLSFWNDESPMLAAQWGFRVPESYDPALKALDTHWNRLKKEYTEIAEQIAYYHHVKTGSKKDAIPEEEFAHHALIALSGNLLNQVMPDREVVEGGIDKNHYPLTSISYRMDAMRDVAQHSGLKLDHFEKAIMSLNKRIYQAVDAYERSMMGGDGEDEELQYTADDDDRGNESWRGDGNGEDEDWVEVTDEELDDEVMPWNDHGIHGHGDRESWQDDDYDPDDERDEHIDDLLTDYGDYIVDFTNEANKIWMDAVMRIQNGQHVTADPYQLQYMKELMGKTQEAYDTFKEASQDLSLGAYELRPVYDLLEDDNSGIMAKMQKIISMASRPAQLEETIKRALPKARER